MSIYAWLAPTDEPTSPEQNVTVAIGDRVTIALYTTEGPVPEDARANIKIVTPGAATTIFVLQGDLPEKRVRSFPGPCTLTTDRPRNDLARPFGIMVDDGQEGGE